MTKQAGLRERHGELTRETILRALVDVIGERGVHEFSVQTVADAAGISHRTVYRHFPTREALLDGLAEWLTSAFAEKLGATTAGGAPALRPEELGAATAAAYRVFRDNEALVDTLVSVTAGARLKLPNRAKHTAWFEAWTAPVTGHLPAEDARAVAAILRVLGSSTTWLHMRRNSEAPPAALESAARWAVDTLIRDLRDGGGPGPEEDEG